LLSVVLQLRLLQKYHQIYIIFFVTLYKHHKFPSCTKKLEEEKSMKPIEYQLLSEIYIWVEEE